MLDMICTSCLGPQYFPTGTLGYPKQRLSPRKWLYSVFNVVLAVCRVCAPSAFRHPPNNSPTAKQDGHHLQGVEIRMID